MGHRALVTYLNGVPDDEHEMAEMSGATYYTHWGAHDLKLYHEIGPDDPMPEAVDEDSYVTEATVEEIATEELDYLTHEAYYVVDANYEVTPYRTLWYELTGVGADDWRTTGFGALIEPNIVEEYNEDGSDYICDYDNTRFAGAKTMLQEVVNKTEVTRRQAFEMLNEYVRERWANSAPRRVPIFSPFGRDRYEDPPVP